MSEKNYASKTIFQHRKKMLILAIRHNQTFARLNIFPIDLFQRWYKWIIFHIKTAPFLLKISAKSHKGVKILEYCSFNIFKEINKSPSTVGTENPARRDYLCLSESWPQCETTSAEDGAPAALSFMLASPPSGWWWVLTVQPAHAVMSFHLSKGIYTVLSPRSGMISHPPSSSNTFWNK